MNSNIRSKDKEPYDNKKCSISMCYEWWYSSSEL